MILHTYLNFGGNCKQAFEFYEKHLGGKITLMMTHGQAPGPGNAPPEWKDAILHARLELGGVEVLASDVPPERFQPMRSVYLSLTLPTIEEAERTYKLLSEGGEIYMPMAETFFAPRFAQFRDRFGTSWMVLAQGPQTPR